MVVFKARSHLGDEPATLNEDSRGEFEGVQDELVLDVIDPVLIEIWSTFVQNHSSFPAGELLLKALVAFFSFNILLKELWKVISDYN